MLQDVAHQKQFEVRKATISDHAIDRHQLHYVRRWHPASLNSRYVNVYTPYDVRLLQGCAMILSVVLLLV